MDDKKREVPEGKRMPSLSDAHRTGPMTTIEGRARASRIRRRKSGRIVMRAFSGGVRASSVLSSRGQVVIPSEIRDFLKADKGDRVIFQALNDHTMVVRIEKKPTSDQVFGILQAKVQPEMRNRDWDDIRRIAKQRKADEYRVGSNE